MRLGCSGCFGIVAVLSLAALLLWGTAGAVNRMLADPGVRAPAATAADGSRAQRKLFDLARPPRRAETVTLTEAEVNGLLTRHLVEVRGVSLDSPSARLTGGDRVVVTGRSSVHHLLEEAALGSVGGLLPRSWQAQPLWLQIGGRVRLDDGARPHLRVDVDEFAVGRQRLPTPLLRVLLDPAAVGLLQWAVPPHIESVAIEPGRVVIRTAPPS